MITRLKRAWLRFWLRRFAETARYADLSKLYAIPDPWSLSSEGERCRFEATNAVIREMMPDCRSLLELGCGEGLQTRWLLDVSKQVTGLDVSDVAVSRARQCLPGVEFRCGKAEDVGRMFSGHRFDFVTLCEMLHYSPKGQDIVSQAQALTDHMIVTSYADRPDRLRVDLSGPGWFRMPDIVFGDLTWNCYGWRRP